MPLDLSRLMAWTRLSKDAVYIRRDLIPQDGPDGEPGILALIAPASPDGFPSTRFHSLADLESAAADNYLSTSDDPLYLVAPGDVVEVSIPNGDGTYRRARYDVTFEPGPDETDHDAHPSIAAFWSDPAASLGLPPGSFASAAYPEPDPRGSPIGDALFHRDSPDSPWVLGPRIVKPKAKASGDFMADATNPPF